MNRKLQKSKKTSRAKQKLEHKYRRIDENKAEIVNDNHANGCNGVFYHTVYHKNPRITTGLSYVVCNSYLVQT